MSVTADTRAFRNAAAFEWLPVAAGLLLLFVPTIYGLAGTLWTKDDFAHGPVILAVIVWLIWDKRQILLVPPSRTAPVAGLVTLVFGLLLYVIGRSQDVLIFEVGALAPILAGVLLAMRGWPAFRALAFMLFFIVYLVPLPGFFVDAMTLPLKQHVSDIAAQIIYAAGYPIAQSGVVLTIGKYQLLVADACSGLNSMFSLSALGFLYLYLMHYKSWLHNGVIIASLLPIAFCANVVRVVILVLVTYYFGDETAQGFVHKFSGMVLFLFALVAILALDWLIVRVAGLKRRGK
jgi:exosortase B